MIVCLRLLLFMELLLLVDDEVSILPAYPLLLEVIIIMQLPSCTSES